MDSTRGTTSTNKEAFNDFLLAFQRFVALKPDVVCQTMSNIFSMRQIGNKTHGDLAEIALSEFINRFLDGYSSKHVGKDLFRAKQSEEDISVLAPNGFQIPISIKAYGNGPLQLSTNKDRSMFTLLEQECQRFSIVDSERVGAILRKPEFFQFQSINVFPLIYDEKRKLFNIMIFDIDKAYDLAKKIILVPGEKVGKRTHDVYQFLTQEDDYIFEVRYGDKKANALQRGMWTHTLRSEAFFVSLTGWMKYDINKPLLDLIGALLISTSDDHQRLLSSIQDRD